LSLENYQAWEIRSFSKGQVEKANNNVIPDGAAYECCNFIATRIGSLAKRKGQVRLNITGELPAHIQGLHPFYARESNDSSLIAMSGGLGYLWEDNKFEEIDYAYNKEITVVAGKEHSLFNAALFNLILFNDDRKDTEDNVEHFVIVDNPRAMPNKSLFNQCIFNAYPDDVFPLDPSEIVVFDDAVHFVVGMNGKDRPFKWDGNRLSFLHGAPMRGKYPVLHKEKIFCVDSREPSTLRWSETFQPEVWPAIYYWDVNKADGDKITNLQKFMDDLMIFKNRAIYVLKGTAMEDFSMLQASSTIGCVGPLAATTYRLNVFFVSEYGIFVTNGSDVQNISDQIIPDTWAKVNHEYLYKAAVTAHNDLLYFSLPYEDSRVNNLVLVYDHQNNAFFPMTGNAGSCYCFYNEGQAAGVGFYAGDTTKGFVNVQDQGEEDFGEPIEAYWKGKFFDMGMPEIEKKSRKLFMQDSPDTEEVAEVAVCVDYNKRFNELNYNNLQYYRSKGLTREYNMDVVSNRWQYLSPKISHKRKGKCEIRGITIPFKPKRRMAVSE